MKVCIVGASRKLGKYMVRHALDRGHQVVRVCRERSVGKLDGFQGDITIVPGTTNDRQVIEKAVAGCDGVLIRASSLGSPSVLVRNGSSGARSGASRRATGVLLRVAPHPRRPGRLLAAVQVDVSCRRLAGSDGPLCGPQRPGGGVPAGVCQRHALDCGAREQPRRGREPGPACVEPARRGPHPPEQYHSPRRLRSVHGPGPGKRRTDP